MCPVWTSGRPPHDLVPSHARLSAWQPGKGAVVCQGTGVDGDIARCSGSFAEGPDGGEVDPAHASDEVVVDELFQIAVLLPRDVIDPDILMLVSIILDRLGKADGAQVSRPKKGEMVSTPEVAVKAVDERDGSHARVGVLRVFDDEAAELAGGTVVLAADAQSCGGPGGAFDGCGGGPLRKETNRVLVLGPVRSGRGSDDVICEHAGDVDAGVLVSLRQEVGAVEVLLLACDGGEDEGAPGVSCGHYAGQLH